MLKRSIKIFIFGLFCIATAANASMAWKIRVDEYLAPFFAARKYQQPVDTIKLVLQPNCVSTTVQLYEKKSAQLLAMVSRIDQQLDFLHYRKQHSVLGRFYQLPTKWFSTISNEQLQENINELLMLKKKYVILLGTLSNVMQAFPIDNSHESVSAWVGSVLSVILDGAVSPIEKFDQLSAFEDRAKKAMSEEQRFVVSVTGDAVVSYRIETTMTWMRRTAALAGIALATRYAYLYGKKIFDDAKIEHGKYKQKEFMRVRKKCPGEAAKKALAKMKNREEIQQPEEVESDEEQFVDAESDDEHEMNASSAHHNDLTERQRTHMAQLSEEKANRSYLDAGPTVAHAVAQAIYNESNEHRPDVEKIIKKVDTALKKADIALEKIDAAIATIKPKEFIREAKDEINKSLNQVKTMADGVFAEVKVEAQDQINMALNNTNMVFWNAQKVRGDIYAKTALASGLGVAYWYIKRAMSKHGAVYTAMKKNFQDMVYILTANSAQSLTPEDLGNLIYISMQLRGHASAVLSYDELQLLGRDLNHIIDPNVATISKLETLKFMQKSYSFLAQKQAIII